MQHHNFQAIFLQTLQQEASSLYRYNGDLSDLDSIICTLLSTQGRVALIGIGKSGLVARKISATLSSTGTSSIFIHPAEAMHGDLGMLQPSDCVIAISYSGESEEIVNILPHIKRRNIPIITMTKARDSRISLIGDYFLPIIIDREACPLQAAPTTSTTLTMAMGDAIAICLINARGFSKEDFALFHPGGNLGRELFVRVLDIMQKDNLPLLNVDNTLKESIVIMTQGRLGNALFVDSKQNLLGILSDGDLRRAMFDAEFSLESKAFIYATKTPKVIYDSNTLAIQALQIMRDSKIQLVPIVSHSNVLEGVVHLHDLLQAGFRLDS
ncbi:KpsF/GutQ family sugar-phosphate isomerase [Helicobacter muridarum]|uniref:KpsF protein n=1 Tax=Helicobacter muridarum TaxID=216 RepID=A0A099TXY9_9HELI|nr:KpsF/GutQ family sugar-phosphate isomerase [Helicobacter muridarum]TLD98596.1 KpsF/GutQ family sugar-phosphate isomerase [Helicobacter muridarum]STQ85518.1 KpsF protein [Helicobacter muridarum]